MKSNSFKILVFLFLTAGLFSSGCNFKTEKFVLVDAKIALGIDDKFMPIDTTDTLPAGTSKVFCWFQWKNAPKNTKILTHWHYTTEDMPILDYTFVIPKKNGTGSVSLEMPQGKSLPGGTYRIDLLFKDKKIKSVHFTVKP